MQLRPCGPVADPAAAERTRHRLGESPVIEAQWPALAPIFAASPYLAALAARDPARLERLLQGEPGVLLTAILTRTAGATTLSLADAGGALRRLKSELHLLTALCDLGGIWSLDEVTSALTDFADAVVKTALAVVAAQERAAGRLSPHIGDASDTGPVPGLFCLALGKHGAGELNYSSDIDVSIFYEPAALPLAPGVEAQAEAVRITRALSALLQERTAEGYVFRVDLRLRPDPSSTPIAMPVEAALVYYETAGQNWERAAMIKARPCAGDLVRAESFLAGLKPFVWRRNLDYAAIADIGSIKRQIHIHKVDERLAAPGHNLKLGAGGIREIEFYVQTQQLILGGRAPGLRCRRTLDALAALTAAGHVAVETAAELSAAYVRLRGWEHRVQMVADEQTHTLAEADAARDAVASLSGSSDLAAFDAAVSATLEAVNARYAALFAEDEDLSSPFGSLVFTGVEDDPETLETLARMGFSNPAQVSTLIRAWHTGRSPATRSPRGRELFTRLAPRLLEAAEATGAPDPAFNRFADFFNGLTAGVQVMSLFLAKPDLLQLLVRVMAYAPELASTLARQPGALDALLDPRFFHPLDPREVGEALDDAVRRASSFEKAMAAARIARRDQAFRIGVQVMSGAVGAREAGRSFAALADACLSALAPVALSETVRLGGGFPGEVAVVALGRAGSREMTARSDLDLMTLYAPGPPGAASEVKGWSAETFYARFTQRLTTALSAPTAEGGLYAVDLQLRPSGRAGPVAVSLPALADYYAQDAETWELLALTRARVVWASSPAFFAASTDTIVAALRRPRERRRTSRDVLDMRTLMARERPPRSRWDLKLTPGGLVDIEFAAQALQIAHAAQGGPLYTSTSTALDALMGAELADPEALSDLRRALALQSSLQQLLKLALPDATDPCLEPLGFRALLAAAAGERDFETLETVLTLTQDAAHGAYVKLMGDLGG